MGGENKAMLPLGGKPLVQHVIDRMSPQTAGLVFSVDSPRVELEQFGLTQVTDPHAGSRGPLGGLLAAMEAMPAAGEGASDWLLLAPCDAPFLPWNLADRLQQQARASALPGCLVRYQGELHPTFSLWQRQLLPSLRTAVLQDGLGGFKQYLGRVCLAIVDWEDDPGQPFLNVNRPADLHHAEALLARHPGPIS